MLLDTFYLRWENLSARGRELLRITPGNTVLHRNDRRAIEADVCATVQPNGGDVLFVAEFTRIQTNTRSAEQSLNSCESILHAVDPDSNPKCKRGA